MKNRATKAESDHMAKISRLNCIICGTFPVEVHHITDCGRRLGHFFTLPLCVNCHRGNRGFSGKDRSSWDKSLSNQLKLLNKVYYKIGSYAPEYKTKIVKRRVIPSSSER